jgi:K+-transporting ATPase c subunit
LNSVLNSLEQVRDAARLLHQRVETAKDHAAIGGDLQTVASASNELAVSLQALGKAQKADAKNHLEHAATLLQAAALTAKSASASPQLDPKATRTALLNSARSALQCISLAIAAQRASSAKRSA